MGTAILAGIMEYLSETDKDLLSGAARSETVQQTKDESAPRKLPTKFNACVRSRETAERIRKELGKYNARVTVRENDSLPAINQGDVALLACEPDAVSKILGADGVRKALAGKLLISVCAGVTEQGMHDILYSETAADVQKCTIVRAMPNVAAAIRESMTVIATSDPALSEETDRLITWIFTRIGIVRRVPPAAMDVCTALCGSGPAFAALVVESMAAGAISMGLNRGDAYAMAVQAVRGSAGLLLEGEHPALLRDKISTPGGGTINGLLAMEEGGLRSTVAKAVRESARVVGQMGTENEVNHER
ncbi:hypothetical protein M409DRAFT_63316 [Zasmidium cellare ATCC 36951]|uniref:Pyrroline-5-carboxylate reductase n=1 Tax=Zasmidium cellare ATCC 36951 TaxID=1080233 RepID=A0A6A6D0L5_ZASCE|nr:uncharacterized protein M409DRAFT_63316 [Zasmidium cellare ATCC 36951]KAF2171702.1 hypothetical protein M409DRAFT_63316 [Zasmidium cellare ATCC 36951]